MPHPWPLVFFIIVLCGASILCATALRRLRAPGWPMLGGIVVGTLLGPTIAGRVLHVHYERWILGGIEQREARDSIISRQGAELLIAERQRLNAESVHELKIRHAGELAEARAALSAAHDEHQSLLRWFTLTVVATLLFTAGSFGVPRDAHPHGWMSALSIGAWSAGLPGALAYGCAVWLWNCSTSTALMVAAAVGIGSHALTPGDRDAANQAELGGAHMVQTAGRVASVFAILAASWSLWSFHHPHGLLFISFLAALPLGWALSAFSHRSQSSAGERPRAPFDDSSVRLLGLGQLVQAALIPSLAACVAVRLELYRHFAIGPMVLMLLLSDDGRWVGAFLGAIIPGGRQPLRTMRLVLGSMAAAPTQLGVAALGLYSRVIPESFALALLAGCLLIELTAPARRILARRILETEEELERSMID